MNIEDLKRDFSRYRATYVLSGLTVLVWLAQFLNYGSAATSSMNLYNAGALFGQAMLQDPGQLWRLVTPIFVHIGWTHLLMNVLTLFFMGRQIETIFGWRRFTGIYLLAGIFGNALSFFIAPNAISAGASGAIFGLFGAVAGLGFFTGHPFVRQIGKTFAVLIIVQLLFNSFSLGTVNIWAHLGGAAAGALLSAVFPPKGFKASISGQYRLWATLVFFIVLAMFIILPYLR